jgi:two-component system, LytTR family, response regulator
MNILIIEDEALVARDIQNLLRKIEPAATIVATIASVDATKKWLSQHGCPDLILSDIQLSDGVSFEVFENMSVSCPIIQLVVLLFLQLPTINMLFVLSR